MVNRRDFLKIGGLSAIAGLLPSLPNSDSNKDKVEETLDETSHKNTIGDMAMASYMTFLFGGKIVPNFMSGDTVGAVKTAWIKGVLPYLSFSSPTARKKWIDEYTHSIVGVAEIVGALNMADMIHIDYHEKMTNFIKSQHEKNGTNKELLNDSIVKQGLQKYNLIVSEESESVVSIKNEKIEISREFLEENITVFFRNPDDFLENLKSHISDESIATETEKLFNEDRTSGENMPEDEKKGIMDKLIKKDVIELKDRINFLTGFIFITPFLTGVGQANQLKKEIKHISNGVKELYISAGFAEDMAIGFAAQMEAKLTSYWFDRFAFDTDIGPIVAAYQKNGISGVWSLIKSMAPISGANVLALNTEVDDIFGNILKERGIEIDAPKEKQDIVYKIVKAILSPVFDGLVSGKNAVKGAFTGKGSQESMRFRNNQMWLNNVMGSYIEEETNPAKDNTISYECYNDPSKIIETLEGIKKGINTTFGIDQDLSGVQMKLDIGGKNKNLFGVILYMLILEKHHLDNFELKDKEKIESLIDSILNTNKFDFTKVIQALEFQKKGTTLLYKQELTINLKTLQRDINVGDVVEFLDKKVDQVDFARDLAETHFENVINSLVSGRAENEDFGTLNLSIKEKSSLKGNPKSIASSILKNMEFLRYLENDLEEEGIEDIFEVGVKNLKENINNNLKTQNINQSFSKLLGLLDKNKDKDKIIDFYARYINPECTVSVYQNNIESEILSRKETEKEDSKKSFFKLSNSDYDLGEEENFNDLDVYRNIELLMYLQETNDDTFGASLQKFIENMFSEKKFKISSELSQTIAKNDAKGNELEQLINLRRIERFYNEFVATEDNSLEKIKITNIEEVKKKGLIDKLKSLDVKWLNHIFEATGYINEKVDHSVEGLLHFLEAKFGKNSAEVIIMILLVQSPFIEPLIKTLKSVIGTLLAPFPKAVRKYAVGFVTYLFSMFADNYIGEIVGVDLLTDPSIGLGAEEGKGMDINEAIGFAGSLAIIGGSADLLGNAPHAIIETYKKWYGTSSNEGGQEIDYEKADGLLHKIMGVMGDILGDVVSVGAAASDPVSAPGIGGLIFQSMKPNLQKMYDISAENGATEGFCSPFGRYIGGVVDAFKPPPKTSST